MDFSSFDLNFNPVQNVQTYEVCTVFSVNFSSGLKEDTPIVLTIIYDTLLYIQWKAIIKCLLTFSISTRKTKGLATCQIFNECPNVFSVLLYDCSGVKEVILEDIGSLLNETKVCQPQGKSLIVGNGDDDFGVRPTLKLARVLRHKSNFVCLKTYLAMHVCALCLVMRMLG